MTREEILQGVQEKFKDDIVDYFDKSPHRVYIEIKPEAVLKVATHIFKELKARFNIATGVDTRHHIEILYHFILEEINLLVSLRVKLDRARPQIDSLSPLMEGANWIEREIFEMLGVKFNGHPELKRLLLGDEWPEGVYPLRQDYQEWDQQAIRDRGI